ncbi:MAG: adenylate/guanylate cyclase domain-containing protein [Deltaproteobacteria bacterium]
MDHTGVGDTTNLASRMESLARPGRTLVSANTVRLASGFFEFKSLGEVEVKGKSNPQEVFELIKAGAIATRIEAAPAKRLTPVCG